MFERNAIVWFEDPDECKRIPDLFGRLERDCLLTYGGGPTTIFGNPQPRQRPFNLLLLELVAGGYTMAALIKERMQRENEFNYSFIRKTAIDALRHGGLNLMEEIRRGNLEEHGFPREIPMVILTSAVDIGIQTIAKRYRPVAIFPKPTMVQCILNTIKNTLGD